MRQFLVVSLLLILIIPQTYKVVIHVYYQLNKQYIAANLCEKRAEIQQCCLGKCHLRKLIQEDDQNSSPQPSKHLAEHKELLLFFKEVEPIELAREKLSILIKKDHSSFINLLYEHTYHPIFIDPPTWFSL